MGLAALILGIFGLASGAIAFVPVLGWLAYLGGPASILAIILGAIAANKAKKAGTKDSKATAGMVLGIISVALSIVAVIAVAACAAAIVGSMM